MPSPEEMRELAQGIVASHRSRRQAIASLRDETDALMKELAEGTKTRQMGVRIERTGYRNDHQAMAKEVRAELGKVRPELEADNAALMKELGELDAARQAEVKSQLAGYQSDHQAMAKELHANLEADNAALMKELGEVDAARQAEVKSQLAGYQSDHQAMGQEVRGELAQAKAQLKADTAALMKEVAKTTKARKKEVKSQMRGHGAEMKAVRTAWQQGLRTAPPKPPVKVAPPPEPTITVREEVIPDDLIVIRGIGASMEERLNRHGIVTYAQLAEASPAELEAMLGNAARLANVEEWIAQAKELAG